MDGEGEEKAKNDDNVKICDENLREYNLWPIEEERESLISSRATCNDYVGSEAGVNYHTSLPLCDEYQKMIQDLEKNQAHPPEEIETELEQNSTFRSDNLKNSKNTSMEESSSDDKETSERNYFRRRMRDDDLLNRLKSEPEASGDNDDAQPSQRDSKSLWSSFNWMKRKLTEFHAKIMSIERQLNLDKFQYRQCALQNHERCLKAQEDLKCGFRVWRRNVENKIKAQMLKWQYNERKRISCEIIRIVDLYSQENFEKLRRSMKNVQIEESRRTIELIKKERHRRKVEVENLKRICEKMQQHLEHLEGRSENSYLGFQQQMDAWEERLKNAIAKLFENTVNGLRKRVISRSRKPNEWQSETRVAGKNQKEEQEEEEEEEVEAAVQRTDRDCKFTEDDENGTTVDFYKIVQILKPEFQAQRDELLRRMDEKFHEMWIAFEEFKHNFHLDLAYQAQDYFGIHDAVLESSESDMLTESEGSDGGAAAAAVATAKKTAANSAMKNRLSDENMITCKCSGPDWTRYCKTRAMTESSAFHIVNEETDN